MKNRDLEKSIRIAIQKMPAPDVKELASLPVEKIGDASDWSQETQTTAGKPLKRWIPVMAIMSVVIFAFTGIYIQQQIPVATVALDVNPSIELTINKQEKILEARALNEEAKEILSAIEYNKQPLQQVVRSLVSVMLQEGYISQERNTVMVSVEGKRLEEAEGLGELVKEQVHQKLSDEKIEGDIITQAFVPNQESKDMAEELGISIGKMHMIERIMEQDEQATIEDLEGKPIRDLARDLKPSEPPGQTKENTGPPKEPPGQVKENTGPPSEPPGQTKENTGPSKEPPGQVKENTGPPSDPPGQAKENTGPPKEPPGQVKENTGPPKEPPGQTKENPGPPKEPPGQVKENTGPPKEPPGQVKENTGPPKESPGQSGEKPGPPKEPPGQAKENTGPPSGPPGQSKDKKGTPAEKPSNKPNNSGNKPNG